MRYSLSLEWFYEPDDHFILRFVDLCQIYGFVHLTPIN